MSLRTIQNVRITGSLRNSANQEVDLTDLLHTGDVDLSAYSTTSQADALYSTAASTATAVSSAISTTVPGMIGGSLAAYPAPSVLLEAVNRELKTASVPTADASPASLFSLSMASLINYGVFSCKLRVVAGTDGVNLADNLGFSTEIAVTAMRSNTGVLTVDAADRLEKRFGSHAWSVTVDASPDSGAIDVKAVGPADKHLAWKGYVSDQTFIQYS